MRLPSRRLLALLLSATAVIAVPGAVYMTADPPLPSVGGVPLFATWPKEQTPDAVIVLSGQTWGYLRPCGCSVNQKGGLERRANLIAALKAKGWPVVAADLGDVAAPGNVHEQDLLKYTTAMAAMREMGYSAVGTGSYDFDAQFFELLSAYTYQNGNELPVVLSANLARLVAPEPPKPGVVPLKPVGPEVVGRSTWFKIEGRKKLAVEATTVGLAGRTPVGFVSVVGKDQYDKIKKIDPDWAFLDNPVVIQQSLVALAAEPEKPDVKVLLYQGGKEDAVKVAAMYPQFQVILCQSGTAESEPPQFPTTANGGKTLIVQVGHKGQNVGVVGLFKTATGYDLKYQLVPLTEDFVTPPDAVAGHKVLALLDRYALDVKRQDLLARFTANPSKHAAQIQNPAANLRFVGSDACTKCHAGEAAVWAASKHSHAMEALEKIADRPRNRQFDGECVICHTVGFRLETGYTSDAKTPHLRHVGCESCHGPGSGHAASPTDKALLATLSPWKQANPGQKLPGKDVLEKLAATPIGAPQPVKLTPAEQQVLNAVGAACVRCHDTENDPKFDVNKYMPKIWHSGLKPTAPVGK